MPIPFALASVATGRMLDTNDGMMRTFGLNASDVGKTLIYSLLADQEIKNNAWRSGVGPARRPAGSPRIAHASQ